MYVSLSAQTRNVTIVNIGDGIRRNSDVHMTHFVGVYSLSAYLNYPVGS